MGIKGVKKLTAEERERIEQLLKCGKTTSQIVEETGRNPVTIGRIRKELRSSGFDIWGRGSVIAQSIPVANVDAPLTEVTEKTPVEEKQVFEEPVVKEQPCEKPQEDMKENNDFVVRAIKKVAKLRGECTGFDYSINSEYQDITIRDERYTLFVKRDDLDGFIRELTEILDEIKRI